VAWWESASGGSVGRLDPVVCVVADRDAERVRAQAGALAGWLACVAAAPADVAATLARRGGRGTARAVVVARDAVTLREGLSAVADGRSHPSTAVGSGRRAAADGVWVFSGYGAHWPGMGRHLLDSEPAFAAAVDALEAGFRDEAGYSLRDALCAGAPLPVERAQPVTFALQVALAALWRHHGVRPAAVIGHSMGEVAAAVVAEALSPLDGIRLICRRARLLSRVGPGAMAVAELAEEEFHELAADLPDVSVAVVAAPRQLVVTGQPGAVALLSERVTGLGHAVRVLTTEGAGHSPAVDPLLPALREALRSLRPAEPRLPFYSTVIVCGGPVGSGSAGGGPVGGGTAGGSERPLVDAAYWAANLRRPVRFADAVRRAAADGHGMFLEISPHPVLVRPLRDTLAAAGVTDPLVAGTMRREDPDAFDRALATLCAHGHRPRAAAVPGRILDLPAPPWRGERHWVDLPSGRDRRTARPALLDGLLGTEWRERPAVAAAGRAPAGPVAILGPAGDPLVAAAKAGRDVVVVPPAEPIARLGEKEAGGTRLAEAGAGRDLVLVAPGAGVLPRPAQALSLAEAVVAAATTGARRLWIVTRGGAAVGAGEAGRPDLGWVRGFVRTLAFEQPLTRVTWLDLDPAGDPADQAAAMWAEIDAAATDDEVAYRGGRRWAARLVPLPAPDRRGRAAVREGGSYIVTGGYGGIGLRVASWLAAAGAGRLVLVGRSGPGAQALEVIGALRKSDVDVRVELGDISEGSTAARVVAAAGDGLAGVVHAAGVLRDALVSQVDATALAEVWAPKVTGAWQLHRAVEAAGTELDWWVSFSSAAALLGSPGQAAYAGANAWLDAFARWQRAHGTPAMAIGWGTWAEVGGAAGTRLPGLAPIAPDDGTAAFRALASRVPMDAGVLHFDPKAALAAFPEAARLPFFEEIAGDEGHEEATGRGRTAIAGLPAAEAARVVGERIAEHVRAVLGVSPPPDAPLVDSGLDSLAAIRIKSLIEVDLGRALPTSVLVRGATLNDLAEALAGTPAADAQATLITVSRPAAPNGLADATVRAAAEACEPEAPVDARDAAERAAMRVFAIALGRDLPGIDWRAEPADLERIAEAARREYGVDAGTLHELTPAALAVRLRAVEEAEVEAGGPLRPLRTGGTGRPLFLGHPAGGSTVVYRRLVELLNPGFPVYGLERLDGGGPVAERAAHYLPLIRRACPDGPYRLGGWSFGGALAFEIARQLTAEGAEVGTVLLIDAGLPEPMAAERAAALLTDRFTGFLGYLRETYRTPIDVDPERLRGLTGDEQFALVVDEMTRSGVADRLPPSVLRHQLDSHWDTRALDDYPAGRYDGPVTLYRCTRPTPWAVSDPRYEHADAARGWDRWCTDLRIVPVDGHHLNLLDPPAVDTIAADLHRLL
jgi:thioesterase domain-containing protein/malonyl CoA-acyl carrier protein transacylase